MAGRAQPEARGRAKAFSLSLPAHWARLRGGPRPWDQASPTLPCAAATRARLRTFEVDRRDRRVLLERGRQSCRAGGAHEDVVCGGAAHPRPRAQVSATRFQAEARAQGTLARERAGPDAAGRASAARGARPRKGPLSPSPHIGRACAAGRGRGTKRPQPLHPPLPPGHARALSRLTSVTVVFVWSAAARAFASSASMNLSAAGQHTRDPEPKSAPHDSKPKHARKGSLSVSLSASGAPARQAAAMGPSVPDPSTPRVHRVRSRTGEVERRGPSLNCSARFLHLVCCREQYGDKGFLGRSSGAMAPCRANLESNQHPSPHPLREINLTRTY
jgi:hypothetical protein